MGCPRGRRRGWHIEQVGYSLELGRQDQELLLYHWHPQGSSHLVEPHLHLGPALQVAMGVKRSIHLPTGQVSLVDFVSMLIREFGVRARRRDWRSVLENADV